MQNNNNRAAQFLAFDALKGFRQYLKMKERVIVPKKIRMQDHLEQLDYTIKKIEVGNIIRVVYYNKQDYVEVKGMVSKIDLYNKRYIQVVKTEITLDDIYEIEMI